MTAALPRTLLLLLALVLGSAGVDAGTTSYRVLMGGQDIGHLTAAREGDTLRIDYDYKQNARGPTVAEQVTLDEGGMPRDWRISGRSTFGKAIDEQFGFADGMARWRDAAGEGELSTDTAHFYIPQSGSPMALGLLARALLADPDHGLPILPGGEARLTRLGTRSFDGEGGQRAVTTYQVDGIDIQPSYVMLDAQGDFFAFAEPYLTVVRAGYESADAALREEVAALASRRLEDIQRAVAHRHAGPVRVRNVHLFDPETRTRGAPVSVLFEGERITAIEAANPAAKAGETVIDGAGGTLLPGMVDMHAHLSEGVALLYLAAGVTSVRDLGNDDALLSRLAERIGDGTIGGPRVFRSGFIEGASPFSARTGRLAKSEAEAIEHVRWYAGQGMRQIKLYSSIDPAWVPAIATEARRLKMRVTGHVPAFASADAMIEAGYDEMTHINLVMLPWVLKPEEDTRTLLRLTALNRLAAFDLDGEAAQRTIGLMADRNIAINPTLGIFEGILLGRNGEVQPGFTAVYDHVPVSLQRRLRESFIDDSQPEISAGYRQGFGTILRTASMMRERGIRMFPGTDMGAGSPLGFSRELELFEKAGYSAAEVLGIATAGAAAFLGADADIGKIAPGRYADFLLVPGNPTQDLGAIRAVSMVVAGGTIYYPEEIHRRFGIRPFATAPAGAGGGPAR